MTTDYAIRAVVFLANCKERVTVKDISESTGITAHYLIVAGSVHILKDIKELK